MILAAVMCCGLLVGCGGKPKEVSQEVYDLGVETCDVLDDYIQGKMSQDTAADKLDELGDRADELEESIENSRETTVYEFSILLKIGLGFGKVSDVIIGEGETYAAEDLLKELKEDLNLKQIKKNRINSKTTCLDRWFLFLEAKKWQIKKVKEIKEAFTK